MSRAKRSEWPNVLRASGSCLYISAGRLAEGVGDALNTDDNFFFFNLILVKMGSLGHSFDVRNQIS
jgi:hypothetical protein